MYRNTGFPYRNISQYAFWRIVAPLVCTPWNCLIPWNCLLCLFNSSRSFSFCSLCFFCLSIYTSMISFNFLISASSCTMMYCLSPSLTEIASSRLHQSVCCKQIYDIVSIKSLLFSKEMLYSVFA